MGLLALSIVLFHSSSAKSATYPCAQVASTKCSRDYPFIVAEGHLDTEEECVDMFNIYASKPALGGCSFAAWKLRGGTCTLYNESFANYISHCQELSGPPDISGC